MIVIFKPDPPFVRWCEIDGGRFTEHKYRFDTSCLAAIVNRLKNKKIEGIGHFLYNGGDEIDRPARFITPAFLGRLEQCVKLLPEYNTITFKTAQHMVAAFPDIRHILLCDTAFFTDLPPEASTYAIPYELRKFARPI